MTRTQGISDHHPHLGSHSSVLNLQTFQTCYFSVRSSDPWSGNQPFPSLSITEVMRTDNLLEEPGLLGCSLLKTTGFGAWKSWVYAFAHH